MGVFIDTINRARQNTALRRASATGAVILTGAVIVLGTGGGGSAPVANLWVAASGVSSGCTRSATPAAYDATKDCSWTQAYNALSSGDSIYVKGGTYSTPTLPQNRSGSPSSTWTAVPGETVVLPGLEWRTNGHGPDNTTVVGPMKIGPASVDGASCTTFDNIDFDGNSGTSRALQGTLGSIGSCGFSLKVKNSQIHNTLEANGMSWFTGAGLWIEHTDMYDAMIASGSSTHTECSFLTSTSNVTLLRNHLWNCNAEGWFITGGTTWPNAVVENNVIEITTGAVGNAASGLAFRNGSLPSPYPTNISLRYNTFMSGVQVPVDTSSSSGVVMGNYFRLSPPCGWGSITYSYNVTNTGTGNCGGTGAASFSSASILAGFTNPITTQGNGTPANKAPQGNYALLTGSPLKNIGNTAAYPIFDLAGFGRYAGSAPDVGAYEFPGA